METFLKQGDKVITSKGRFGKISSTNGKKSIVTIGSNNVEIYNTELYLVDNVKSIEVEYYRDKVEIYKPPLKDIVYVSKKLSLFDFNNPMANPILDECKIKVSKHINYNNIIITKLMIV